MIIYNRPSIKKILEKSHNAEVLLFSKLYSRFFKSTFILKIVEFYYIYKSKNSKSPDARISLLRYKKRIDEKVNEYKEKNKISIDTDD